MYPSHLAGAAIFSGFDYKATMNRTYHSVEQETHAYSECHTRSAKRVLKALLANGGLNFQQVSYKTEI
jgi:aarF domain-containing kinase